MTTLGVLLDDLTRQAAASPTDLLTAADAAHALGHLARALQHLTEDGLSPTPGDHRHQQVTALVAASRQLAARAPVSQGRLTNLAAATADSLTALRGHSTAATRWAITTAVVDTVAPLAELTARSRPGPAAGLAQTVAAVGAAAGTVEQLTALHPPAPAEASVLDRPLTPPTTDTAPPSLLEATAGLAYAVRRAGPLSVRELRAVTLAAQTLTRLAQQAPGCEAIPATEAWAVLRRQLHPFEDGARRPASGAQVTAAALHLHTTAARFTHHGPSASVDIVDAAQHLPALAALLRDSVRAWARHGGLLGYARDLPPPPASTGSPRSWPATASTDWSAPTGTTSRTCTPRSTAPPP